MPLLLGLVLVKPKTDPKSMLPRWCGARDMYAVGANQALLSYFPGRKICGGNLGTSIHPN